MTKEDYFSDLNEEERDIIINKGTETPFSGKYNNHFDAGVFICRACKNPLYESNSKFDSGCGWPSFDDEIFGSISRHKDLSGGRERTEICCNKCGGHLGHVFYGEKITEKDTRHCVNSLSIQFKKYNNLSKIYLGAGCFWTVDAIFSNIKGVYMCQSGYMGGNVVNLQHDEVRSGKTNHVEVVEIFFDEEIISLDGLLKIFWGNFDPKNLNRRISDIASQYIFAIFYNKDEQKKVIFNSINSIQKKWNQPINIQIKKSGDFFRAEEHHQRYFMKNKINFRS